MSIDWLSESEGYCRPKAMRGFLVTMTWKHFGGLGDVKVDIKVDRPVLRVVRRDLGDLASRRPQRPLRGSLPDLETILKGLANDDRSTAAAILCYIFGSKEASPCTACQGIEGGPFGGCYTLDGRFGGTCASCLLTRCNAHCEKTKPLELWGETSSDEEVIDLTGDDTLVEELVSPHGGKRKREDA